jgi:hypothetical protein
MRFDHNEAMMKRTGAVIFHSPAGDSSAERMVDDARMASACDLIESLRPLVPLIIVVCSPDASESFRSHTVQTLAVGIDQPFHFGDTLKRVVRAFDLASLVYFGSGSGTLLTAEQLREVVHFVQRKENAALFNNFYSCDFAAFTDASSLLRLPLPKRDNGIGFLLADSNVKCYSLPRSLTTQFDVDTPADVLLLKESGRGGPAMRRMLESLRFDHHRLQRIHDVLVERTSLVYLVGRVSPVTWRAFERQVACRTAGMIEGRGMKAYADSRSPVLASLVRTHGYRGLFRALETSADAAIIDTRPLLARNGLLPPARDRFSSDLFRISEIEDPAWREFTQQALDCSIPVLLGGHSLVSGGLYLLSETCWKGRNLPRRLHPDSYEGDGSQHEQYSGQARD